MCHLSKVVVISNLLIAEIPTYTTMRLNIYQFVTQETLKVRMRWIKLQPQR